MNKQTKRYVFARHARERFQERFSSKIEGMDVTKTMARLFYRAEEDRSFLNNTRFLVYMLDKYGDFKKEFRTIDGIVFVCDPERMAVVTVFDQDSSFLSCDKSRFRANKRKQTHAA